MPASGRHSELKPTVKVNEIAINIRNIKGGGG